MSTTSAASEVIKVELSRAGSLFAARPETGGIEMQERSCELMSKVRTEWQDSRGITGLETAIVLIAFVVVSSVFAFAALSTGLFSSDKAKESIKQGLAAPSRSAAPSSPRSPPPPTMSPSSSSRWPTPPAART